MKLIDNKLGGTTPLNIIIKFPEKVRQMMMMMTGVNKTKMNQNIGSLEIKLIKLQKCMIILIA